jgi:hypothetical protein
MNVHVKKTVPIEYYDVAKAYQKLRKGGKAVGIDQESWTDFDKKPDRNLYVVRFADDVVIHCLTQQ